MEFLKNVGYTVLAIIGLAAAFAIATLIAAIGATLGSLALGLFIVFLIVVGLKEYFEGDSGSKGT